MRFAGRGQHWFAQLNSGPNREAFFTYKFFRRTRLATVCVAMIATAFPAKFNATDLIKEAIKFAAFSVKNGMRAVFPGFFADQSWLLRPEPVDARTWLRLQPDPPIVLDWKSQRTILSAWRDRFLHRTVAIARPAGCQKTGWPPPVFLGVAKAKKWRMESADQSRHRARSKSGA